MNTQSQPVSPSSPDLEATAELPALDLQGYEAGGLQRELGSQRAPGNQGELSSTDTWVVPGPAGVRPAGVRPAKSEERSFLEQRTRLEDDLKSLATNLRELETRLGARDARVSAVEKELESARAERAVAEQRAGALGQELTDARIALSTARSQLDELTRRLEAREAETAAARTQVRERDRSVEERLAERERALAHAEARLEHLQQQAAAQLEALHSIEGRHGVLHSLLRGLDSEVSRRDSRVEELRRELQATRDTEQRRAGALQSELAVVRSQLDERTGALRQAEARHAERNALLDAGAARLQELEARVAEQAQLQEALQGQVRASQERIEAADADLRVAEESLRQLEGDVRAKNARIEELTKLNDDWRTTLEEARRAIEERDALIERLEGETARSTALLDSIQHSMRLPDEVADGGDGAPEGATRLLIRGDGDGEVVHVLGRRTSIGRTPDNDVQIDTRFVSRHHAMILIGPHQTLIEDLNSTNGVLVNGRRVTRQSLKDGDALVLGKTQFRFTVRPPGERRAAQ